MASLSNINGLFDVHSTGAILFSTSHGTSGQILKSNGNAAPTWVAASTVIGGPYLPLSGGTLTGATATASGISFTVGGALSGTSATFSGSATIETGINLESGVLVVKNATGDSNGLRIFQDSSDASKIYNNYNGTLQLGVGNTTAITIDSSENTTFAGSVTGTNATFTAGTATAGTPLTVGSSTQTSYTLQQFKTSAHSSINAYLIAYGAGHGSQAGNFAMKNVVSSGEIFFELASGVEPLRMTSTGSTFAGSVTATTANLTGALNIDSALPTIKLTDTDTSAYARIRASNGGLLFEADESNTQADSNIRFEIDTDEKLRIDSSGNVGIGDTNPASKLVVAGRVQANSGSEPWAFVSNPTSGNYGGFLMQYGNVTQGACYYNSSSIIVGSEAAIPLRIQAGGQYAMHIDASNRNVHIGGTNNASQKLEVTGNFKLNGTLVQEGTGNNLTYKYRTANSNAYSGGNANCKFGRFYWTPAHWVTGAPVIKVTLHCKYYEGERREYIIKAGYQNTDPIINELQPSSTSQRITLVVGATTSAGYNYAGQPVYYVDLQWVQTAYIWGWAQIESQVGFLTSNPTSGWGGVVMDSGITQTNGGLVTNNTSFFAGNLGIGTGSPASKFEVYGGNSGVNDVDRYIRFKASNGEKRFDFYVGGTGNASSLGMYTSDGTTKNVQISAGGTSYFNAGNVGIGTTTPGDFDGESRNLVIRGGVNGSTPTIGMTIATDGNQASSGRCAIRFADGINGNERYRGALEYNHNGDDMSFRTAGTQKMTLTDGGNLLITSGNVGIGTNSPARKLCLYENSSGQTQIQFQNSTTGVGSNDGFGVGLDSSEKGFLYHYDGGDIYMETGSALLYLQNSGGNVGISNTSPQTTLHTGPTTTITNVFTARFAASNFFASGGNSMFYVPDTAANIMMFGSNQFGTNQIEFYHKNPGTSQAYVGRISTSGSATSYVTSSDYRLKENIVPISDSISRLNQLKPSRFNFIEEPGKIVDGFIAHEVQDIVPEAIVGEKDEVDEDGGIIPQGIDQAKLVPLLVAAMQELEARVKELENK